VSVASAAPKRPVLRYHGGKFRLSNWVIKHLPPHRVYVEPFCGAASILMQKPRVYAEVINDLDLEVVNLFRILRDPERADCLRHLLEITPFAREEFNLSYEPATEPIEAARRLVVRSFMGFGSAAHNPKHKTGFRNNANRSGTTPAHDWVNYLPSLEVFTERLAGVVIENRDALEIMPTFDGDETLFYVDPPYPISTRSMIRWNSECDRCYVHEMTDNDHRALASVLHQLKGMVVLSGYRCDLYDTELFPKWTRIDRASHADGARARVESLYFNDAAAARLSQGNLGL